MSDYLANLAARGLGLAAVVRPRLASLFEPLPVAHHATGPAPLDPEGGDEPSPSWAASLPRSSAAPREDRDAPARAAVLDPTSTPTAFRRRNERGDERLPAPAVARPQSAASSTVPSLPAPVVPGATAVSRPAPPARASGDRPASTREAAPEGAADAPAPERERVTLLDRDAWRSTSERLSLLERRRAEGERPASPLPIQAQAPPKPGETADARMSAPVTSAIRLATDPAVVREPPPVIRITIGRVDVRAIMPSPPVERPKSAPPRSALSLDDYLKRRGEGGR